jgi:hypothetical protein
MNVLALTILISVCLAGIFIVCFIAELKRNKRRGIEHDSLLPLDDDESSPPNKLSKPNIK